MLGNGESNHLIIILIEMYISFKIAAMILN